MLSIQRLVKTVFFGGLLLTNPVATQTTNRPQENEKNVSNSNGSSSYFEMMMDMPETTDLEPVHPSEYDRSYLSRIYGKAVTSVAKAYNENFNSEINKDAPGFFRDTYNKLAEKGYSKEEIAKKLKLDSKTLNFWEIPVSGFETYGGLNYKLLPKQSAFEAIENFPHSIQYHECATGVALMAYQTIKALLLESLPEHQARDTFDLFFGSKDFETPEEQLLYLGSTGLLSGTESALQGARLLLSTHPLSFFYQQISPSHPAYHSVEGHRQLPRGTMTYFRNDPRYLSIFPRGIGVGWNVMCVGQDENSNDLFTGFGVYNVTEQEIRQALANNANEAQTPLDRIANPTLLNFERRVTPNDISFAPDDTLVLNLERIHRLITNPQALYDEYRVYLQSEAKLVKQKRDMLFKQGNLSLMSNYVCRIYESSDKLHIDKRALQNMAYALGMRLLKPTADNHTYDIVEKGTYKIMMRISFEEDEDDQNYIYTAKIKTQFSDRDLLSRFTQLQDRSGIAQSVRDLTQNLISFFSNSFAQRQMQRFPSPACMEANDLALPANRPRR